MESFTHVVCYKLAEDKKDSRQRLKEIFLSMPAEIPCIQSAKVGCDEIHSPRSFDAVLILTFSSRSDYEKYRESEYHKTVVQPFVHSVTISSISVDFSN